MWEITSLKGVDILQLATPVTLMSSSFTDSIMAMILFDVFLQGLTRRRSVSGEKKLSLSHHYPRGLT